QAGTLSGNPLAVKMGLDVLRILKNEPEIYERLEQKAKWLEEGFNENIKKTGVAAKVTRHRSMLSLFFGEFDEIKSYDDVAHADTEAFADYFNFMFDKHILIAPAQFEALFLSDAHNDEIIDYTIRQNKEALEFLASK